MHEHHASPRPPAADTPATPRALQELAETVQRSRLGGPFYLLAWFFAGLAGDLFARHPLVYAMVALAFIAFTGLRLMARPLPEGATAHVVQKALDRLWVVVLLNAATWGGAAAWLLWIVSDDSTRTVTAVCSYAFATAAAYNFCMRRERALLAIGLMHVPVLIAYQLTGARFEFVAIGVFYLVYVVMALRRSHREYLQRLDLEEELRRQRDRFEQQSQRDGLTGLANRRAFTETLDQWIADARAAPLPFALLILDLDWFKAVNDRHGHAVGDATLRAFAQELRTHFAAPQDFIARLGGEEFAVLLRDTAVAVALQRAESFRDALAGRPLPIAGLALGLTVSIGVGGFEPRKHVDGDALYQAVDKALYGAKASGRNAVREADTIA